MSYFLISSFINLLNTNSGHGTQMALEGRDRESHGPCFLQKLTVWAEHCWWESWARGVLRGGLWPRPLLLAWRPGTLPGVREMASHLSGLWRCRQFAFFPSTLSPSCPVKKWDAVDIPTERKGRGTLLPSRALLFIPCGPCHRSARGGCLV